MVYAKKLQNFSDSISVRFQAGARKWSLDTTHGSPKGTHELHPIFVKYHLLDLYALSINKFEKKEVQDEEVQGCHPS